MENPLVAIIRAEITHSQYLTFARFMELALYHPELGYYRRKGRDVFGIRGDFYTAGQLQPVFGELLSSFVKKLREATDADKPFEVLDLGAGRQDLRAALHRWGYRGSDWNTPPLTEPVSGVIIANEFFDALPVHILRKGREESWRQVVVKVEGADLVFGEINEVSPALVEYAGRYGSAVPEGGLIEVSLAAGEWIRRIGRLLTWGSMLIIDYGYEARELIRLPEGTMMGYQEHSATGNLLKNPGGRDLTAHVNFSYLRDRAFDAGLEVVAEFSLGTWALSVWNERELAARWSAADERWRLQWKQLIFGMGNTFRVLHLRKREPPQESPQNKNASVAGGVKDC